LKKLPNFSVDEPRVFPYMIVRPKRWTLREESEVKRKAAWRRRGRAVKGARAFVAFFVLWKWWEAERAENPVAHMDFAVKLADAVRLSA